VGAGAILAKISNPKRLKAVLKIPESQARDTQLGLPAMVEVLNTQVAGKVIRIDPAVVEGSVKVDVALGETLPQGARPDLSVVGTIEIERLSNILYVERPVFAAATGETLLFKLVGNGGYANKVRVHLGRSSVSTMEVLEGLKTGEEVILSDMSRWESAEQLRIN
jgi:hypothetical protein